MHAALIWFLARLALCFAFGVSFAVISPLSPLSPLRHCPQVTVIDCCHWWKTLSTFLSPSLYVLLCLYLTLCCPQNALIVPHSQFSNGPSNLYISHGIFHIRNPQKSWINYIGVLCNFSESESPFTIASIISYMKCFALKTNHKSCRHPTGLSFSHLICESVKIESIHMIHLDAALNSNGSKTRQQNQRHGRNWPRQLM